MRDRAEQIIKVSRYTIVAALEVIFDDNFGLSDGDSSDENGDDIYGYVGEPVLRQADIRDLSESIVGGPLIDREEGTDNLEVSEQNESDLGLACPTEADDFQSSASISYDDPDTASCHRVSSPSSSSKLQSGENQISHDNEHLHKSSFHLRNRCIILWMGMWGSTTIGICIPICFFHQQVPDLVCKKNGQRAE